MNAATTDAVATIITKLVMWIIIFALTMASALYGGWVLIKLWGWFAIPAGMPEITMRTAIGLHIIVGYLSFQFTKDSFDDPEMSETTKTASRVFAMFSYHTIVLFVGWLWNWLL